MAVEFMEIEVEKREATGKKGRQEAQRRGLVPGVVYGADKEPVPIFVDPAKVIQILKSEKGMNSILLFSLKGTKAKRHVMIKDFQIRPATGALLHADFKRILMDQKVKVRVPVVCDGVAIGVKTQGGVVDQIMREVEVECLPADVPDKIHVDLTPLKLGDSIKLSDLKLAEAVILTAEDKHQPVVVVAAPRVEAEPTPVVEEVASVEPEVIGKGKKPEEGEAAAPAEGGKK
jgi:large subunit ribosomal protein L25